MLVQKYFFKYFFNADIEALCVEIIIKKSRNIVINTEYRQPAGNLNEIQSYLNAFLAKSKTTDKKPAF